MKALLDEQLSPQIAAILREEGHDVYAVAERDDLVGYSDRMVLEAADAEDRAVITNNIKDFRPIAAEWLAQGRTHPGLISPSPLWRRPSGPYFALIPTGCEAASAGSARSKHKSATNEGSAAGATRSSAQPTSES